jgi:hypothetical protein
LTGIKQLLAKIIVPAIIRLILSNDSIVVEYTRRLLLARMACGQQPADHWLC